DLAVRFGEPVGVRVERQVEFDHDQRHEPPLAGTGQAIVLTGDCLPADGGTGYLLWINDGLSATTIIGTEYEVLANEPAAGDFIVDCRPEPEPEVDGGVPEPDAGLDGGSPEADAEVDAALPEADAEMDAGVP
ncbi:MAG: hypothetical protein KC613_27990, partial [Myxococcales bacterium]|nr:hypothetical protein [Myxococcales bacterium]